MRSSLLGSFAVIPYRTSRSCAGQFVRLGRHDEVILVETFYFLRLPGDLGPAPSEADIGMVALLLGQVADPGNEVQGFLEVLECKAPLDTAPLIHKGPTGRLLQIAFGLGPCQRRNPAAARRASLGQEIIAHSTRSEVILVRHASSGLCGFKRPAIPMGEIGRRFIAALKEREDLLLGSIRLADSVIGQYEFV